MIINLRLLRKSILILFAIGATSILGGCLDESIDASNAAPITSNTSGIIPPFRIEMLRTINRAELFAEVTLEYVEFSETVTVESTDGGRTWAMTLRVPSGTDFTIQVTWYEILDGRRLDLVTVSRSFEATFSSRPIRFDFPDYDFDGYDDDRDGITNLAEREAGTSPFTDDSVACPIIEEAQTNTRGQPELVPENPLRFTDSFDGVLPGYRLETYGPGDLLDKVMVGENSVTMNVSGDDSTESGVNIVTVSDTSDSVAARVRFSSNSTLVDSNSRNDDGRITIRGVFFGLEEEVVTRTEGDDARTGDATVSLSLRNYLPGGNSRVLLCARVRTNNGSERGFVDATEDGDGDGCAGGQQFGLDFENDTEYLIGVGVDRINKTVIFRINDQTREFAFAGNLVNPVEPRHSLQISARGDGVSAEVELSELSTENAGSLDLSGFDSALRYQLSDSMRLADDPDRDRRVLDGRLRLTGTSADDGDTLFTNLAFIDNTDFLEADLNLSSESSVVGEGDQAMVRITSRLYNDLANGGIDSDVGDTRAEVGIGTDSNGNVFGQACLIRFQSSGNACGLLPSRGAFCQRFPSPYAFDTAYRATVQLDRQNRRIIFGLEDEEIFHDISTNIFLPSLPRNVVETRLTGRGTVVGFIDSFGTVLTPDQ